MLASELPFEILSKIAMFLEPRDLVESTMVSKKWTQPFIEVLWKNRCIRKPRMMDAILETSKQNIYIKYGCHTQKLDIYGDIILSHEEISILQIRFQNIKRLSLELYNEQIINLGGLADWRLWNALTHLDINASLLSPVSGKEELMNAFIHLSRLESLHIQQFEWIKVLEFTLTDFENLHTYLPYVKSLKLDTSLAELTDKDIGCLEKVVPASTLSTAAVCFEARDLRWIYYFARKYPHLSTLECRSSDKHIIGYTHQAETANMLSKLPCVFSLVKKMALWSPSNSDELLVILCTLLSPFKVPVSRLKYSFKRHALEAGSPESKIQKITSLLQSTLRTLSISNQKNTAISRLPTIALRNCSNLVHLYINDFNAFISFNLVLDYCQNLKIFKLDQGTLLLSPEDTTERQEHGLMAVDICGASISSTVFNHMSYRCGYLCFMRLNDVKILGPMDSRTGSFCISMPYTCFTLLHLHLVQFYPTDFVTVHSPIHLIAISRYAIVTQENHHPKRNVQRPKDYYPREVFEYMWHHTYHDDQNPYGTISRTRMLTRKEAKTARRYFRSSRRNKHTDEEDTVERNIDGHVPKDQWEKDLYRGYVSFFCQTILEYEIGARPVYYNENWEKILAPFK